MRTLLFYLIQVILASGILYGYYHLMLRNKRFHQYNRFYLLASVTISVLIPFLNIPVYFEETEIKSSVVLQTLQTISSSSPESEIVTTTTPFSPAVSTPFNWNIVLYIFYTLVALLLFTRILISLKRIMTIIKNNLVEDLDGVRFINTVEPGTPYSFFRWLFWNKKIELRSEKGEQIFRHEIFHIQQKHSLDIIFMELLTVIFWINPFFHFMKKELKAIHEFLADQFAAHKTEKWEYAELLLMQALNTQQQLVNPFFHNQIKRRIAMITNPQKTSHRYLRKLLVLPVTAILVILFAFKFKHKDAEAVIKSEEPIIIVIDAGHGGIDPGTISKDGKYTEAQLALEIAKEIQKLGKEYNVNVVMTREDDKLPGDAANKSDGLKKRIEISEKAKPVAFISIHINTIAGPAQSVSESVSGFEAYIPANKDIPASTKLASGILQNISSIYKVREKVQRSPKAGIFVLDKNSCPSVLVQCGYMTNAEDLAFITDKPNQEKIARKILDAIVNYKNSVTESSEINSTEKSTSSTALNGTVQIAKLDSINSKEPSKIVINGKEFNIKEVKIEGLENSKIVTAEFYISKEMPGRDTANPLIVIDGVKQGKNSTLANIDPASIESVNVFKGQTAMDKYGRDGKNGAIEIFTKQKINEITSAIKPNEADNIIFEEVEIEPAFRDGELAWKRFLERNVNPTIPIQNHAQVGQYTVVVEFVVRKNGSISNVRPLTNHGFGMEQEAVRVIKEGPLWAPGIQNGQKVNAYIKQAITFEVADGKNYELTVMGHKNKEKKDEQVDKKTNKDLNEVVVVGFFSPVLEKAEIEPSFPGGEAAWKEFLKRTLDVSVPAKNNAEQGEYTVWVQFAVHTDGSISDIKSLTNHGFGMEQEAIRIISKGPRWIPAIQNGQKVNAYKKQRVDFVVDKKTKPISIYNNTSARSTDLAKLNLDPRKLYIGIDNSLVIGKDGVEINNIIAAISDGSIRMDEDNFIVNVKRAGNTTIHFFTIENGQKINLKDIDFNVQSLPSTPLPVSVSSISTSTKSNLPKISVSELNKINPFDLFQLDRGSEIVSFNFIIDNTNGGFTESKNTSSQFNSQTAGLIRNSHAGNIIMVEEIRIRKENIEKKIPSRVFEVVD